MVKVMKITRLGGVGEQGLGSLLRGLAGAEKFVCGRVSGGRVNLTCMLQKKANNPLQLELPTLPTAIPFFLLFAATLASRVAGSSSPLGQAQAETTYVLHKGVRGP